MFNFLITILVICLTAVVLAEIEEIKDLKEQLKRMEGYVNKAVATSAVTSDDLDRYKELMAKDKAYIYNNFIPRVKRLETNVSTLSAAFAENDVVQMFRASKGESVDFGEEALVFVITPDKDGLTKSCDSANDISKGGVDET